MLNPVTWRPLLECHHGSPVDAPRGVAVYQEVEDPRGVLAPVQVRNATLCICICILCCCICICILVSVSASVYTLYLHLYLGVCICICILVSLSAPCVLDSWCMYPYL